LNGSTSYQGSNNPSFNCPGREFSNSSSGSFLNTSTGEFLDNYSIEALTVATSSGISFFGQTQLGNCVSNSVGNSNDSARLALNNDPSNQIVVSRIGRYFIGSPGDPSAIDAPNAFLRITAIGENRATLLIEATGSSDSVAVTIEDEESGAVISFLSTWSFED